MWIRSAGSLRSQPVSGLFPAPLKFDAVLTAARPSTGGATRQFLEYRSQGLRRSGIRMDMKNISEPKPVAAQPRTGATPRRAQPARRRDESSGFPRSQARNEQSAERNYERYLLLARAEALTGDRIAAENYFQHAEHYLRLMSNNRIKGLKS